MARKGNANYCYVQWVRPAVKIKNLGRSVKKIQLSALTALALLLVGVVWTFASPRGSSADEGFHLTNIWCAWGDSELCELDPLIENRAFVPEALAKSSCYTTWPSQSGAGCLKDLSMDSVESSKLSFTYSLGFFKTMRVFAGENLDLSVQVMRLFNVVLASILLFWALVASTKPIARALAISWGVAMIPIGIYFIASVNPSSWTIMGVGTFWAFLASALGPGIKTKRQLMSLWMGASSSLIIAILARGESGIYLTGTIGAILIWRWKSIKEYLPRSALLLLLGGFIVAVLCSVVVIFSRFSSFSFPGAQTSTDQPVPMVKTLLELPSFLFGLFGGQPAYFIITDSEFFRGGIEGYRPTGFIFGVGWTEFDLPSLVGLLVGAAVFGVVIIGFTKHSKPRVLAVLFLVVGVTTQIILMRASIDFSNSAYLQPRYFFPYVLVILGIAAVLPFRLGPFFSKMQLLLISTPIVIAGSVAWLATATRYAVSPSAAYTNFGQPIEWWWDFGPGRLAWFVITCLATVLWVSIAIGFWGRVSVPKGKKQQSLHN